MTNGRLEKGRSAAAAKLRRQGKLRVPARCASDFAAKRLYRTARSASPKAPICPRLINRGLRRFRLVCECSSMSPIAHEPFNSFVRDGTAGQKIGRVLDEIKPEAIYFTEQGGRRGVIVIVDLQIHPRFPAWKNLFFLTFNADVEFRVVISPADLQNAGLNNLGKKWS